MVEFWLSWMKESEDQAGDCQAQLSWLHLHWELGWSQESRVGRQSMGIHRTKGRWVRKASLLLTVFLWTATVAVKITMGSDCSHDIKRCLLLWRKAMTNLDNVWKSRDISLLRKVNRVSSVVSKSLWPMDCRTAGFPVHYKLSEHAQTHVHRVSDAIQPTYLLSSLSPPAFNPFQHQGLFQWVGSWHQVAKVLELQLQHQSFQWIFRTDFL